MFDWSMILPENRLPLFGIMLQSEAISKPISSLPISTRAASAAWAESAMR
jgi:hypothetical protein